jgi:hypothetical protein
LRVSCGIQGQVQLSASAIDARSDVVSTNQHGTVGIDLYTVQLLGSSEFY